MTAFEDLLAAPSIVSVLGNVLAKVASLVTVGGGGRVGGPGGGGSGSVGSETAVVGGRWPLLVSACAISMI